MDPYQVQIDALQAERAKLEAKADELLAAAAARGENAALSEDEAKVFDTITRPKDGEIAKLDERIRRLQDRMAVAAVRATPVAERDAEGRPVANVLDRDRKGTWFAAMAHALHVNRNNHQAAAQYARRRLDDPLLGWALEQPAGVLEAALLQRYGAAAVVPGLTTDATWAAPLVALGAAVGQFITMLRKAQVLGRIPGVRQLDFDGQESLPVPGQTGGATGGWVGQNAPIPVSSLAFATKTLAPKKKGVIVPIANELLRRSNPSALELIRDDLITVAAETDDAVAVTAAAANATTPPGLFNGGGTSAAAAGVALTNMDAAAKVAMDALDAALIPEESRAWIMRPVGRRALEFIRDINGNLVFAPELAAGRWHGYPVIASTAVGAQTLGLVYGAGIMHATEMLPMIDLSSEATLSLRTDPAADLTDDANATPVGSLWQRDLTAVRMLNVSDWLNRYAAGTYLVTAVQWG